jgi:hypothetical protein
MYKQSYETQGGASDMYVRMNTGFTYEDFEATTTNVSGMSTTATDPQDADVYVYDVDGNIVEEMLTWTEDNLDDYPAENPYDNTFSPRAFMRGDEIYTGYAFSPSSTRTGVSSNFWIHRYVDDGDGIKWNGPQQVSWESGSAEGTVSALDPRFVPTPKFLDTGLESDKSNPAILFMSYGTATEGHELDVLYSRSTDKGKTFEYYLQVDVGGDGEVTLPEDDVRFHWLSQRPLPVEEKEVQTLGSPDGNMGFNAWLQESEVSPEGKVADGDGKVTFDYDGENVTVPLHALGLESYVGRVDWNCTNVEPGVLSDSSDDVCTEVMIPGEGTVPVP